MGSKKNKKTKEDFTSFLLGEDESTTSPDQTLLLPDEKNQVSNQDEVNKKNENLKSPLKGFSVTLNSDTVKTETKNDFDTIKKPFDEMETVSKKLDHNLDNTHVLNKEEAQHSDSTKDNSYSTESKIIPKPEEKSIKEVSKPSKNFDHNRFDLMTKGLSEVLDPSLISVEAALKQSEYLKLANSRIENLEKELEEIRNENQTLSSTALVLQKKYEEVLSKYDSLVLDQQSQKESLQDEIAHKNQVLKNLEKEKEDLKRKNEEFASIMNEKIHQVRSRERELMNRLELLQLEDDVVTTNKDEVILSLKKQIDKLNYELENYKSQNRELNQEILNQKEQIRKTTKALKLALNMVEHEDADLKKTGS